MKHFKKFYTGLALILMLAIVSPTSLPFSTVAVAEAATVKLNKKSLSLEVGKTYTLKVSGTKKKVTWSTSDKKIATVNKSGKVTAKKAGKATITATVDKKKYTCKVTVTKAINPLVKNAPFEAQEVAVGNMSVVLPKNWKNQMSKQGENIVVAFYSETADLNAIYSTISATLLYNGQKALEYSQAKERLSQQVTKENLTAELLKNGIDIKISDFASGDYETNFGTAYRVHYEGDFTYQDNKVTLKADIYYIYVDNYLIVVNVNDYGEELSPELKTVADYALKSLQYKK